LKLISKFFDAQFQQLRLRNQNALQAPHPHPALAQPADDQLERALRFLSRVESDDVSESDQNFVSDSLIDSFRIAHAQANDQIPGSEQKLYEAIV